MNQKHFLVVADWRIDARAIVAACMRRNEVQESEFRVVVPARLHGLDWAGDPYASVPCARAQMERIDALARAGGLSLRGAVGDPDVLSAISDAAPGPPADELLLFSPPRRLPFTHPLDLAHRARRLTGMPVKRIEVPIVPVPRARLAPMRFRPGHCIAGEAT